MDISKFVVRVAGKIDYTATLDVFTKALDIYVVEDAEANGSIADAVNAMFDTYPGASINMNALISGVSGYLNTTAANFGILADRTRKYVQQNSQGVKNKLTEEFDNSNSIFIISKGIRGGVRRRSDIQAV